MWNEMVLSHFMTYQLPFPKLLHNFNRFLGFSYTKLNEEKIPD